MAKTGHFRLLFQSLDGLVDNPSMSFVLHSDTAADWSNVGTPIGHVMNFVNSVGTGGTNALGKYISSVISRSALMLAVEVYDITAHLDGTPAGAPVAISHDRLTVNAVGNNLPEGCAATCSFQSAYGTDVEFGPGTRPRSRDRNRVYLGPLTDAALDHDSTTHRAKFLAQFVTDALAAMFDLSSSVTVAGEEWVLQQWSRRNAAIKVPTRAWLDDRFDYQRRRSDPTPGTRVYRDLASV